MALFSGRFVVPAPGCSCGISLNLGCRKVGVRASRPRTIFGRAPGSRQEWTDRVRTRPASAARSRPVPRGRRPPALRPSPPGSPRRYRKSWNQIVSVGPAFPFLSKTLGHSGCPRHHRTRRASRTGCRCCDRHCARSPHQRGENSRLPEPVLRPLSRSTPPCLPPCPPVTPVEVLHAFCLI